MKFRIIASILLVVVLAAAFYFTGGYDEFVGGQATEGLPAAAPSNQPANTPSYYR